MTGALGRRLDRALQRDGSVRDEFGETISRTTLRAKAVEIGQVLLARGLTANEPVHVAVGNRAGDLAAFLGVWCSGGVVVPVALGAPAMALARTARNTAARFSVDDGGVVVIADDPAPVRPLLDSAALVIWTSGTTGAPKGVVLGHDRFAGKLDVLQGLLRFTPADHVIVPLRLTFVFGIWATLLALDGGATLTLVRKASTDSLARCLGEEGSLLFAVPSMLRTWLLERAHGAAAPVHAPRMVLTGGEHLGAHLRGRMERLWPSMDLRDLYGSTETGAADFCLSTDRDGGEANSIGRPTEGVAIRIVSVAAGAGREGEAGELLVRSPFGMLGYLNDAVRTADAYEGEYFRTGDVARSLPSGCVELVGRIKEIVSRGGNKISPQEVDELFASHPDVAGALSVGVPHARLGEALHTSIVLKDRRVCDAGMLRSWASERIERFKIPDTIEIIATLPLGPTGKASRTMLKDIVLRSIQTTLVTGSP